MNGTKAAVVWFETREAPRGWSCVLADLTGIDAPPVGAAVHKANGNLWGYACGETGALIVTDAKEEAAWKYAKSQQGFDGDYAAWCDLPADEREEYECGAEGIGAV